MSGGPGRNERKGISLLELGEMFPDDETAEKWFIQQRWPNGVACAHCGSVKVVESTHPTMPFRCKDCRRTPASLRSLHSCLWKCDRLDCGGTLSHAAWASSAAFSSASMGQGVGRRREQV